MIIDYPRAEWAYREFMKALGLDCDSAGTVDTPRRVVKAMVEMTGSTAQTLQVVDSPTVRNNQICLSPFEASSDKQLIVVSDIEFSSLCEHHHLPFTGHVHIGYIPSDKVIGLSKFARIVTFFSKRPQMQERFTDQITEFLMANVNPQWLAVEVEGTHACMQLRGIRNRDSRTHTLRVEQQNMDDAVSAQLMSRFQHLCGRSPYYETPITDIDSLVAGPIPSLRISPIIT